ncbi:MAG: BCCT family transporter [Desulfobacteraceae bacterium]
MKVNPYVFFISAVIIICFLFLGAVLTEPVNHFFELLQDGIALNFGWFYILGVGFFLFFVVWLFVTPYGRIRLGKDHNRPEFSNLSWFAMLFSAGMGIGLLFYSVAEPVLHFAEPPVGTGGTEAAARQALVITFFHWGLHAWAVYIVVGLSLAFFAYRYDLPLSIRSTLYPILGERIYGGAGNTVEILAVFGTLFGVATSLGLGVKQVNAGLDYLGFVSQSQTNQLLLIAVITAAATFSVVSGLDKGIRRLSTMNLFFGMVLLLFVLAAGPTVFLLGSLVQGIGRYLQELPGMTFQTNAYEGMEWKKQWTLFYWGWWISWSPFVGMFIARVSRGRTIRQFIGGVLLVPTLLTFLWMTVFGNTAIHMELFGSGGIAAAVSENMPTALFALLENLPFSGVTVVLATVVVATFFITSSDSGSLVIDILTSGGNPHPPVWQRIFWALTEGAVAAVLLVAGGLMALQTAVITTALPFCVIMLLICYSLARGLRAVPYRSYARQGAPAEEPAAGEGSPEGTSRAQGDLP